MRKRFYIIVLFFLASFSFLPQAVSAVDIVNNARICGQNRDNASDPKESAVCKDEKLEAGENPIFGQGSVLAKVINLLTVIVGIVAVITIILAGLRYITSATNPQDVANARERVIYSLVALVIAAMAQLIVRFIIGRVG